MPTVDADASDQIRAVEVKEEWLGELYMPSIGCVTAIMVQMQLLCGFTRGGLLSGVSNSKYRTC